MNCRTCGSANSAEARFCSACGAKLVAVCAACGSENSGGSKFCAQCGKPLKTAPVQEQPEALARDGLEPVLRSRTMIEGERKEISVLFADITGSTEIVAGLDPEQALARLDGALRAMTAAVRRYGGFDRPQGDGIMALFGAPLADQDHAARACLAALAMQSAIASLGQAGILIRVGVHSGPVVVRSVSTGLAADFDAIGETVHLAARMEQVAEPGTIRITRDTYRQAKEFIEVRALGAPPVKGVVNQVEQFELIGRTSLRTLWDARASSRLTPFVDREAEFKVLRRAATEARAGTGRMVLVSGDPGVGKSRLVHEFLAEFRTDSWTLLRSGAMPFSLNAPYAMFAILLGAWLGLDEQDSVPAERLRNAIGKWQGAGRWAHAAFSAVLGLPEDPAWHALDPNARRRYTLDAIAEWIEWLCRQRPLVLVFEDTHWADGESAAILSLLAERASAMPLLIIASRRLGEGGVTGGEAFASVLRLEPLPAAGAQEMVAQLLGDDPTLFSLQRLLADKTGGVPFFIEETARELAEAGVLDAAEEGQRRSVKIDDIRVPANVRLVLASRIDRLPPLEKELLQIAAVIGYEVPIEVLKFAADLPQADVQQRVLALESAGFLRTSLAGLAFEHMLTRDVAYETLLLSRRRALHQRVFAALERQEGAEAHLLAHHAFQAGLWLEALKSLHRAADRAVALSAYAEAAKLLEDALESLTHLPRSAEFTTRGIDIRLSLRGVLGATLDFARIDRHLQQAREMAIEIGDDRRLGAIAISEAMLHNQRGDGARAITAAELARSMADKLADERLSIPARIYLGQARLWRGEIAECIAVLGADLGWTEGPLRHERLGTTGASAILSLSSLAAAEGFAGHFERAEQLASAAEAIARETERPYDAVLAGWYRGRVLSYQGRMAEARAILRKALEICDSMDVRYFASPVQMLLGFVEVESGGAEDGFRMLVQARSSVRANGLVLIEMWCLAYLALARLRQRDPRSAAPLAREALDMARARDCRLVETVAQRLLGMACGVLGGSAEADQHFDNAVTRAEALGLRPELAHCRFERGLLLRDLQRAEEARRELEMASALYAELGMEFWRAKAAAALDGLGGAVRQ